MNEFLIHYEEYDNNDLAIRIDERMVSSYFRSMGYSQSKSELIVGALEKLAITINGLSVLFEDDERFYLWAKEVNRKQAQVIFGYSGYLLAWIDDYGEYKETRLETLREAKREFIHLKLKNLPAAVLEAKKAGRGWLKDPVMSTKYNKLNWRVEMRHFKWKAV